ncbi:ABC transporter ATP-binding protein [Salsipaludibacter albus]|uniref:ABC transporter ATP-binding protein n=1 Tax=Salsipaludibacter albus TaxID=2849650 RepID=UPI001EE4D1D7|nr:ABC transporter ATP-binding protein [Salsipaludibacter albus]MBY5160960.1 ABC transporter ATP-binding protein [Salsipaludibacter albus]
MSAIDLDAVSKAFGDTQAVDDLSLHVEDGAFFVLLGPSGAGKTTTLRLIAGLETPDEGSVSFDGQPAQGAAPSARDLAMVFQSYALYPKQTARENIASPLRARRIDADTADSRIREVASLLHIDHLLDRQPQQLSGGEQQRVALGRALVREPRAFLMDEPLTNLDVKLRVEMRAELTRLHRTLGATFLYVTNDQAEAMSMADQVAVIDHGRLQQVGTPADIYDRPANRFVATFIGAQRMNLVDCTLEDGVLRGETGWQVPAPPTAPAGSGRFQLGVRPEDMSLTAEHGDATLAGTVYAVEPLGDRCLVDVQVGDDLVRVKAAPDADPALDSAVRLAVDVDRVHLFDHDSGLAVRDQEHAPVTT